MHFLAIFDFHYFARKQYNKYVGNRKKIGTVKEMARQRTYGKFGLKLVKWLDSYYLIGLGTLSASMLNLIWHKLRQQKVPLDWDGKNAPNFYASQEDLLHIKGRDGTATFLPQFLLTPFDSPLAFEETTISLVEPNFTPPYTVENGFQFYKAESDFNPSKVFFNGELARINHIDMNKLHIEFQGVRFFDFVGTNLSLDADRKPFPTLRTESAKDQKLPPLEQSTLANASGVNGLIFTCDGYMIIQKRNDNVLMRPKQICSGFSGFNDKKDIATAIKISGKLRDVDFMREKDEETGITLSDIEQIEFLGIAQELVTEMPNFYFAVDVRLTKNDVLSLSHKDSEGTVAAIEFGKFAKCRQKLSECGDTLPFWELLDKIHNDQKSPISLPFLTNMALWYRAWDKTFVDSGRPNRKQFA